MTDRTTTNERFTEPAIRAMRAAWEASASLGHDYIGTEHLLLGLAQAPGTASEVLRAHGVESAQARAEVVRLLKEYRQAHGIPARAANRPRLTADEALSSLGIDLAEIQRHADETFGPGAFRYPGAFADATDRARKVVISALRQAREMGSQQAGTGHALLGLLEVEGFALAVLTAMGVDTEALRRAVLERTA